MLTASFVQVIQPYYIHLRCRLHIHIQFFFQFSSTCFQPRTRATHARHISHLTMPSLASSIATTYGLTHDPILNSLAWFHSTEGLPPDIMHDILEGALQYEVKEMLVTFTQQKKYFTVGALQNVVAAFKYAYPDVKDKPSELSLRSSDHKLGQGGEENLLTYYLHR